jgi:hypothetical protein
MLIVTERAKEALREFAPAGAGRSATLRLEASGSGILGLAVTTMRGGDHVVEHDGAIVLVIGPGLAGHPAPVPTAPTLLPARGSSRRDWSGDR